jgi:hypothetical protein
VRKSRPNKDWGHLAPDPSVKPSNHTQGSRGQIQEQQKKSPPFGGLSLLWLEALA